MAVTFVWSVVCFAVFSFVFTSAQDPIATVIIYRHGDRTPVDPYPNDPWGDPKYWPAGWGELTDKGKKQHFQLGQKLRERYQHLIKSQYNPKEFYARSTDVDRALMSALSNVAGFYSINTSNEIFPGIKWQPIPIHTVPEYEDEILAMKAPCPKFDLEKAKLLNTPYFKDLYEEFRPIYKYVTYHTGRFVDDLESLSFIYDTLKIDELYNFTLPNWTRQVYPEKMENISKISFMVNTFTPTLGRLKIGPLLQTITNNLLAVANNETTYKVWMYSAHDITISSLLNALRLKKFEMPKYASTLIFELIQDNSNTSNNDTSIRVLYEMEQLKIPNCGDVCSLNKWITNYEHIMSKNHSAECQIRRQLSWKRGFDYIKLSLMICIIAIILLVVILVFCAVNFRVKTLILKDLP